jgi:hypothetical protein
MAKDINGRIAAEISWARTHDRPARTRPAPEAFLRRFEKEVDPDGTLPPEERRQRAEHAKRAYMLQLAKRSAAAQRSVAQPLMATPKVVCAWVFKQHSALGRALRIVK